MARPSTLHVESLESRVVPATFGIPWADARHLTLSFVPDGTPADGATSSLFQALGGVGVSAAAWQAEILRAVQTWAAATNINVDVVTDSGNALGIDGANEGDPRFGDIRIAARPLSGNVLAITTPSGPLGGTRAGDIVLNSAATFTIGAATGAYDLYSVFLQEVGHAFGVSNSTNPASPMFETYGGFRTGLTSGDVAAIQTLYGARAGDAFEWNDTPSAAKEVKAPAGSPANASPVILADLTTAQDVDYFTIKTAASNPNGLTIRLNAGLSLLAPMMTVYDPTGTVLGTVQSVNRQTGEVSISLPTVQANAYYSVKVEDANPTFGVGGYQLKFVFDPAGPDVAAYGSLSLFDDAHTDDTAFNPTELSTAAGYAANTHYTALGRVRDASDVDFYQIRTPYSGSNWQNVLTVNVRAADPTALAPVVQVFNKYAVPVAAQVLANANDTYTVQVSNVQRNEKYLVRVSAADGGTGDYQLDVDGRKQVISVQTFAANTLTAAAAVDFKTLSVSRSEVMYFELSALAAGQAGVRLAIFDSAGHVVAALFAQSGQTLNMKTYLEAGVYTVRVEGLAPAGTALPFLAYTLKGVTLTDPIAPVIDDPSLAPPAVPDFTWIINDSAFYARLMLDALGDVVW